MSGVRSTYRYQQAVKALKARGDAYCWRGCGTWLQTDAPKHHPNAMTLGHIIAYEDRPDLFFDPTNHAPECGPCNSRDGQRRTTRNRHGAKPGRYINTEWLQ
jgi:5-methylcytosine-specific restriction endonuclease McrA